MSIKRFHQFHAEEEAKLEAYFTRELEADFARIFGEPLVLEVEQPTEADMPREEDVAP